MIYVINLQRQHRKWQDIQRTTLQGVASDWTIQRVQAVDGASLPDTAITRYTTARTQLRIFGAERCKRHAVWDHWMVDSRNAVACTLSHRDCIVRFLASNHEYCIIMEDDAKKNDGDAWGYVNKSIRNNAHAYDIVILGHYRHFPTPPECVASPKQNGTKMRDCDCDFFGSHAYYITRHAAKVLLTAIYPIEQQMDFFLASMSLTKKLKVGMVFPSLFGQTRRDSTIPHSKPSYLALTCAYFPKSSQWYIITIHILLVILVYYAVTRRMT